MHSTRARSVHGLAISRPAGTRLNILHEIEENFCVRQPVIKTLERGDVPRQRSGLRRWLSVRLGRQRCLRMCP
jgi:hypothetical protein